jgi:hypothetical protein
MQLAFTRFYETHVWFGLLRMDINPLLNLRECMVMRRDSIPRIIGIRQSLILSTFVLSMMIFPITNVVSTGNLVDEETSIWQSLEHEFPNAIFQDASFLNETHGRW